MHSGGPRTLPSIPRLPGREAWAVVMPLAAAAGKRVCAGPEALLPGPPSSVVVVPDGRGRLLFSKSPCRVCSPVWRLFSVCRQKQAGLHLLPPFFNRACVTGRNERARSTPSPPGRLAFLGPCSPARLRACVPQLEEGPLGGVTHGNPPGLLAGRHVTGTEDMPAARRPPARRTQRLALTLAAKVC